MSAERLSDEDYEYIYSRVPRVTVDLVIESDEGLLLIKRQEHPENIMVPHKEALDKFWLPKGN